MKKIVFLFLSFVLYFQINSNAQTEKIQAILIYNFISKYVEWPAAYKSGDFVIGVLGNSPIAAELNNIAAAKTVGSQKIVVQKYSSASEITKCNAIYIADSRTGDLGSVISKVGNTLIITNKDGAARKGSAINFVIVDNKQKFELNKGNATSKGLKVSPELEKLAIIVN